MPSLIDRVHLHLEPSFGLDPWLNPDTRPVSVEEFDFEVAEAQLGRPIFQGQDALSGHIGDLSSGLDAYMSYVDNFGGYDELVARFGHSNAFLIAITIFGHRARCGDFEPGAMSNGDFRPWYENEAISDELSVPWAYTNAANASALNESIGDRKVVRWWAHIGHGPHICGPSTCGYPQADWTQWEFDADLDKSIGLVLPDRLKPDVHHYGWYPNDEHKTPFGNRRERRVVQSYDLGNHSQQNHELLLFFAKRLETLAHEEFPHRTLQYALAHRRWHTGWRHHELKRRYNHIKGR